MAQVRSLAQQERLQLPLLVKLYKLPRFQVGCLLQLHHLQLQGASCDSPPASMGLPPSNLPRLAASYVDFSFWMLQGAIDFAVRIDCRDMGAPPRAEVLPLPRELAVRPDGTGTRQLPARIACSPPACHHTVTTLRETRNHRRTRPLALCCV